MSDEPPILLSAVEDRIYKVTLNRPAKRNALNREARAALLEALEESRDKASVIILTGAGGTFCAGMDLNQLNTGGRADEDELNDSWRLVQEQIRRHPAIVIASAQGYALGGGSTLINTCDLAVVAEDVQIGMPEIGFPSCERTSPEILPFCQTYRDPIAHPRAGRVMGFGDK